MRRRRYPVALLGLCLASSHGCARSEPDPAPNPDSFVRWATAHRTPVRIAPEDSATADLAPMRALVGNARIVAYGEPTHGTHEPLAFRNRLFRFLVQDMGFTAIAIESGLTESEGVDRYVTGRPGELQDVVRKGISWGFEHALNE